MELTLSGNPLKTFHRSITCLARIGTELVLQASPSQLIFHTINSSRSAYQSITLKSDFFDVYTISGTPPIQCSVLLKAVCAILRTSVASIDRFSAHLPGPDAAKLQCTLECYNGTKKIYWITCNVEPDIQNLSLDKGRFPSSLVVRPRDVSRLLGNFQSTLQEITIIATEPNASVSDNLGEIGGKAVELRSYIDPTKDNSDTTLHTQLWIDPSEEFLQYTHSGDPVDVTFGVKELKAFVLFCEGCEVDIHLFFEKSGEPILMAPRFGFDDSSISDFDAKLVLATMLTSQIQEGNNSEMPNVAPAATGTRSQTEQTRTVTPTPTSHTKIWSDLSARGVHSVRGRQIETGHPPFATQIPIQMTNIIKSKEPARENQHDICEQAMHMEQQPDKHRENLEAHTSGWSQHHPSNWLDDGDDGEEEDDEDEFVMPTPQNSN